MKKQSGTKRKKSTIDRSYTAENGDYMSMKNLSSGTRDFRQSAASPLKKAENRAFFSVAESNIERSYSGLIIVLFWRSGLFFVSNIFLLN